MIKERIWAIEVRPRRNDIPVVADSETYLYYDGSAVSIEPAGAGTITTSVVEGPWTEWVRSYSFEEIKSLMLDVIQEWGAENVRIVEVHNVSISVMPDA